MPKLKARKFLWIILFLLILLLLLAGAYYLVFAPSAPFRPSILRKGERGAETSQLATPSLPPSQTPSKRALQKVKIADSPKIITFNTDTFFPKWGWWVRRSNLWAQLTFEGIDTSNLASDTLVIEFNLGVTNKLDGDENLDGVIDIQVNPGKEPSLELKDVILANLNRGKPATPMHGGGTYKTFASIKISTKYVIDGKLVLRILRHPDTSSAPSAVGKIAKIEKRNGELIVPKGVYENDDPKTVHLNFPSNTEGTVLKPGVVTIYGYR